MDKQLSNTENKFLGSGWTFPVTFSIGNLELNLTSFEDNINESIDLILLTKQGERCLEPNFGSGLQKFFFRKMDETLKGEIIDVVKTSLLHNEPRISVEDIYVEFTNLVNGIVKIKIVYYYNQTNTRHNYVFPFHLKEGTNLG